jgi:hypothetical protein
MKGCILFLLGFFISMVSTLSPLAYLVIYMPDSSYWVFYLTFALSMAFGYLVSFFIGNILRKL